MTNAKVFGFMGLSSGGKRGFLEEGDLRGRIGPMFGLDSDHERVVELYDKIGKNGYNLIYLTGRSTSELEGIKEYLFEVKFTYFLISLFIINFE